MRFEFRITTFKVVNLFLLLISVKADRSFEDAIKVLQRRHQLQSPLRDMSGLSRYETYENDDIADMEKYENRKNELENALSEYLQNAQDYTDSNSLNPSSYRETVDNPKSLYAYNARNTPHGQRSQSVNTNDYLEFLNSSPAEDSTLLHSTPYKRYNNYNYNSLGYNSVGLRKRQPYSKAMQNGGRNIDNDETDYPGMYAGSPYGIYRPRERRVPFYPVTKRSSDNAPVVKRTDPKIEKELSQLFSSKKKIKAVKTLTGEDKTKKKVSATSKKPIVKGTTAPSVKITTDPTLKAEANKEQPLQMSKKSVKWSDYFGIDRRKKSSNMDNEWLLNRYHKAVELAKAKKSAEYPLKNFHNHEATSTSQSQSQETTNKANTDTQNGRQQKTQNGKTKDSIENLDEKLEAIEESIIDDALKFTGASGAQDDLDGEEMKDIKDSIIARLAIAYNVEKMRKALREYRQTLALRHIDEAEESEAYPENEKSGMSEEKRVAVPRKQAVDVERPDGEADADNNIKCTDADENCVEQNYKVPREFMEQATFEKGGCERIERACREVSLILGPYGPIFEMACNMHQMCMLCSDNSWFSPTRQCNILFLSKADQLCDGNVGCQRSARESIKYLQHVDRAMRSDLSVSCNLECPDKR